MITPEITLAFLLLLGLLSAAGMDVLALTTLPPLNMLVALGYGGTLLADLIAQTLVLFMFVLLVHFTLAQIAGAEGEEASASLREQLARGNSTVGVSGLLKLAGVLLPLVVAWFLITDEVYGLSRLLFVMGVVELTIIHTLYRVSLSDLAHRMRNFGEGLSSFFHLPRLTMPPGPQPPDPFRPGPELGHEFTADEDWREAHASTTARRRDSNEEH